MEKITHSYPHCWRHQTPVVFRTTPQWFISMDKEGLRDRRAESDSRGRRLVSRVGRGTHRRHGRRSSRLVHLAPAHLGRADRAVRRQVDSRAASAVVELMEQVAQRVEKSGVDAWYALDPNELLGADADDYEKVTDILDVWFDSGVTHFCVLDQRRILERAPGDKVMYLEGSDQHRGWFQSSLLTSTAMHGRAPYDEVLTHGFTVDAQGRKMSQVARQRHRAAEGRRYARRRHPAPVGRADRLLATRWRCRTRS